VLDLGFDCRAIGDRAFSDQPSEIVRYAGEFIRGMRSVGMAATGKHFPGHGGVLADSHLETPFDARENIKAHDMAVFKGLIEQNLLDAMMPAHVIYPAFDDRPASGSSYWLKTVLRKELNFSGVIFSDDLDMKGADIMGSYAERALKAQQAGCDMVMLCNNRKGAIEALDALPQTQVPLLNSLLKKPTFENVTETQQWKREQQEIAKLRDEWLATQA
jgi:beta-N-acetylhexosaminidase